MTIEIIRLVNPKALYGRYSGQTQAQPAYIELDLEDKVLSADWNGEIGNAVPMDVWHGLRRRYHIPCLVADDANSLMEEILPLAERVLAGSEVVWDGNNWVAKLNEDAEDAEMEIDRMCEQAEGETVSEWEASDFFGEETDENLGVKIGMDINAAADILREKYPEDDYSNPIVILHLENFLENRLEELKEKIEAAAEAGDDWMLEALVRCDEDGRSREEWYEMTWPEFSQALTNDILPDFKTIEELDAFYDAAWNRLQRDGIIAAIEAYNEGRPDHMQLHFDKCKKDFVDPDAGEWKPYGAWNHRGDLVFVCGTIGEARTMLGRIEADEELQEQGWGEGSEAYKEYQKGEY